MENGKFWLIVVALSIGYFWGKSGSNNEGSKEIRYHALDHSKNMRDLNEEKEELERKLEEARSDLEDAVSSAEDAEFHARMRWVETGRTEDLIRLNSAEDATNAAQNALDNLESN
jgi:hypothetical protein